MNDSIIGKSKPGLQKKKFQRLKRGDIPIEFEIDLHGKTLIESEEFLNLWLPKLRNEGKLTGIVIHGKGYHSDEKGPKLKNFVKNYLESSNIIVAYHSAIQKDGGTGAVYIILKKWRRKYIVVKIILIQMR